MASTETSQSRKQTPVGSRERAATEAPIRVAAKPGGSARLLSVTAGVPGKGCRW